MEDDFVVVLSIVTLDYPRYDCAFAAIVGVTGQGWMLYPY